MDALRMPAALLSLGRDEGPLDDAMTAIASFPTIVGTYWRLRNGEAPVPVRADLAHAADYLHQPSGTEPSAERARALETYLNTVLLITVSMPPHLPDARSPRRDPMSSRPSPVPWAR